jgi:TDG/mug DNA glycosylase family protein
VTRKRSFPPILGRKPRVLILGSLPGDASLALGQYYGHPQNKFWELLGAALGEDLRSLSYARRVARLKKRGVAVWDMIAHAHRVGSLDSSIRFEKPNDIPRLIKASGVRAVFFNGGKAKTSYRRHFGESPECVDFIALPSSSPAHASMPWTIKRVAWKRVAEYL